MAKFKTCANCGAHLDHGEKCTCEGDRLMRIEAKRSGTGVYFLYNSGGRFHTYAVGRAQVLTGQQGEPLKSYGDPGEMNGRHALCKVELGQYVIRVVEYNFGYPDVNVYQVVGFEEQDGKFYVVCKKIYHETFSRKEYWDTPAEVVDMLGRAIYAAIGMCETVGCCKPFYVRKVPK